MKLLALYSILDTIKGFIHSNSPIACARNISYVPCKEERKKQDLLSYEVYLNYHIEIREVLKEVCQYYIGEK